MERINLDPIEDYLDGHNLLALIERWLAGGLDVEKATKRSYETKIKHFITWWQMAGPGYDWRLTKSRLAAFEVYLRSLKSDRFQAPLSYNTRFAVMRTLRMMFRWAATTNRTTRNYGEWVPWPEGATPRRKAATSEQLARLLAAAAATRFPSRDQAILAFFIGTGCRLSEVAGLRVSDLQLMADGAGTATVTGKRTAANPTGQHAVAFDSVTGHYLVVYMDALMIESGPLWINDDGEQLGRQSIYRMFRRVVARAGLTESIKGCHDLRRAFATILIQQNPNSPSWGDVIRRQLGHAHYSMTSHYTLLDVDDIKAQIISPLALV